MPLGSFWVLPALGNRQGSAWTPPAIRRRAQGKGLDRRKRPASVGVLWRATLAWGPSSAGWTRIAQRVIRGVEHQPSRAASRQRVSANSYSPGRARRRRQRPTRTSRPPAQTLPPSPPQRSLVRVHCKGSSPPPSPRLLAPRPPPPVNARAAHAPAARTVWSLRAHSL